MYVLLVKLQSIQNEDNNFFNNQDGSAAVFYAVVSGSLQNMP